MYMGDLRDRFAKLAVARVARIEDLRANRLDKVKDRSGSASAALASALRFLGVMQYVLHGDIHSFRSHLAEAAEVRNELFVRYDRGEPISGSYVAMLSYQSLMNALAAGNLGLGTSLAVHMGGRGDIEREHDHPFDLALGYALKSTVLDDSGGGGVWIDRFEAACRASKNRDFEGYALLMRAILSRDSDGAVQAISRLLVGHIQQCKGSGIFKGTEDELLCVWGIGIVNLARIRGMSFDPGSNLIPSDLLV